MLRKNIILLIAVLVFPFVAYVHDVDAVNYNCSGNKKEVRECLEAVISERDATIEELQGKLDDADARLVQAELLATSASNAEKTEEAMRLKCEVRVANVTGVVHKRRELLDKYCGPNWANWVIDPRITDETLCTKGPCGV